MTYFNQLNVSTKIAIISELSGVKRHQVRPVVAYNYVDKVPTTGFTSELATHGLSRDVLDNLHHAQIHVDFGVPRHNPFLGHAPNDNYLNINKSHVQTSSSPLMLKFSSTLTPGELDINGLDDASVTGAIAICEDDDIRDVFTAVQTYISTRTSNTQVTQVLQQLIEGYDKAMALPTDLLERIVKWTPISIIIDSVTGKIVHSYSDYHSGDDNDDECRLPLPQGRNVFNIHRNFANGGFIVGYDHSAAEYTGYRLSLGYVPFVDSEGGKLKIGLTYNNTDNLTLSEVDVSSHMSVVDVIDSLIAALADVKDNEKWGEIVSPLVNHAIEVIEEVKPFVVATLK